MSTLLQCPPEIVLNIFQSCDDFRQVLAPARTCKSLQSTWTAHARYIIWTVASNMITCFDDALVAVRAQKIVQNAQSLGILLPQRILFQELRGVVTKPSINEVQAVLDLRHMLLCIERIIFYGELVTNGNFDLEHITFEDWTEEDLTGWRQNFHRAMHRMILAGAIFARAYTEPFISSSGEKRGSALQQSRSPEYLASWPAFNVGIDYKSTSRKHKFVEDERFFGPFTDWMHDDAIERSGTEPVEYVPVDGNYPLQELLRLMAAHEFLAAATLDLDSRTMFRPVTREKQDSRP